MLQDDYRGLHIWPLDMKCDRSRAFSIDNAIVCCLDLMLPIWHGVKGLKEVTIAGDMICCSGVMNPSIGRSTC